MASGIELAKAYVQIVPSATGIQQQMESELGVAGDRGGKEAGKKAGEGFSSVFGGAVEAAAAAATAALAAAGTALVGITKSAVESYADYEQLSGGVETIFKSSSDAVMKYAENAYKTAGMSANDYMETVTGFSASLIQGLGGDTDAAAELANQALIDMSDNANKMGTDISSIQNAYQGFAKQNYTMLDNLKLGYGGTQSEMIRLINDSGVLEEKIDSLDGIGFDTIIEAIHQIQTNLEITGTTAQEAESTITGSFGQVSAAWENMLAAAANPDADFGGTIDAFMESVLTASGNLVPVILRTVPNVIKGLSKLINELLPQLFPVLEQALPAVISGIEEFLKVVTDDLLPRIPDFLRMFLPTLITAGLDILFSLIDMIPDIIVILAEQIPVIIGALAEKLTDPATFQKLIAGVFTVFGAVAKALMDSMPIILGKLPDIIMAIVDTFLKPENLVQFIVLAGKLILEIGVGMIKAVPELVGKIPEVIAAVLKAFGALVEALFDVGGDLLEGLWKGISEGTAALWEKISGWLEGIWDGILDFFGIHSPSKEMTWVGKMLDAGLAKGISANVGMIDGAMADVFDATSGSLESRIAVAGTLSATGSGVSTAEADMMGAVGRLGADISRMQVVLDTGVLVGTVDTRLGQNSGLSGRGVAFA